MRISWLCAVALAGLAGAVRAEDAPSEPPAGRRVPTADVGKPYVGIRWERDFDEGMRRAAKEGRGVYLCENGRVEEGEGGTTMLWRVYQGADLGAATAGLVCFVVNATGHATAKAGRDEVCARYGCGTCAAHRAASAFVMARFSTDQTIVSPSHFLLDPDGRAVYQGEFMQSALSPSDLEAWFVRLSPRHALRSVWGAREARTSALGKAETAEQLRELATAWIASKDPLACAGVVATLDQETDPARRKALFAALATAGPDALPVIWDAVDGVATDPDVDRDATAAWLRLATQLEPMFGAWATARAMVRTTDLPFADTIGEVASARAETGPDDPIRAVVFLTLAEAFARISLRRGALSASTAPYTDRIRGSVRARLWPAWRAQRALAWLGSKDAPQEEPKTRDDLRRALADPDGPSLAKPALLAHLRSPIEELRVAAAVALRRAGDPVGADVLLKAIE
ncbi:MAG: hypothetical protein JNM10_04680, partial [Planctomycetia bacterium]|nr:hypothetical protein [Planctomycetia bacterium]